MKRSDINLADPCTTRHLVGAFPHRDLRLLQVAARAFASMIDAHDALRPDPEARNDAARLLELADILHQANTVRGYIDGTSR